MADEEATVIACTRLVFCTLGVHARKSEHTRCGTTSAQDYFTLTVVDTLRHVKRVCSTTRLVMQNKSSWPKSINYGMSRRVEPSRIVALTVSCNKWVVFFDLLFTGNCCNCLCMSQRNVQWWEFPVSRRICRASVVSCNSTLLTQRRLVFTWLIVASRIQRSQCNSYHRFVRQTGNFICHRSLHGIYMNIMSQKTLTPKHVGITSSKQGGC